MACNTHLLPASKGKKSDAVTSETPAISPAPEDEVVENEEGSDSGEHEAEKELDSVPKEDFKIRAKRDYGPDIEVSYSAKAGVKRSGNFIVPQKIIATGGSAYQSWVSLIIGHRKFCYKGMAKNSHVYSEEFELKYEKEKIIEPCDSSKWKKTANRNIEIGSSDEIMMTVHKGGCHKSVCAYVEAEAMMEAKD